MHIDDLPDDVLCLILERVFIHCYDEYSTTGENHALLAACRRWRRLVLPMVYSHVSLAVSDCGARPGAARSYAVHSGTAIRTGLDRVASAGCMHMVKRVCIQLHSLANPAVALSNVAGLMRAAASEWVGVRALAISTGPDQLSANGPATSTPVHSDMEAASDTISRILPGVSDVTLFSPDHQAGAGFSTFFGRLAASYAAQLTDIALYSPVAIPRGVAFGQLRSIRAEHKSTLDFCLPRADPEVLETLELKVQPQDQIWQALGPDDGPREIRFSSLKKLTVLCHPDSNGAPASTSSQEGGTWRLHFPSLQMLDVDAPSNACPLFECAVLPPRMHTISISVMPAVLRTLADTAMPAVRNLKISIGDEAASDPTALVAANAVLANTQTSKEAVLAVGPRDRAVDTDAITCTTLTVLTVNSPTSVDKVLGLIGRLPNLVTAAFQNVCLGPVQADISIPGPRDSRLVAPLDTKLRALVLLGAWDEPLPIPVVQVARYLMLSVPTLTWLCTIPTLNPLLDELVCVYSERYQHLNSGGSPQEITFPSLRELRLSDCSRGGGSGVGAQSQDGGAWRFHFPNLETLHAYFSLDPCSLLDRAVLPSRMDTIKISAGPAVLRAVADMVLPAVRRIQITIMGGAGNDPAALPAACRILSSTAASRHVRLTIYDDTMTVVPNQINANTLTRLVLGAPASVDTMLGLVQKLPRLVILSTWNLLPDEIRAEINTPGPGEEPTLEPLNTRIRSLVLNDPAHEWSLERLGSVARYLVLRIPTLVRLRSDRGKPPLFEAFVAAYRRQYPHLDNIKFVNE
ncbi:hypothetical protein H4R18_004458 [Coemansia javaensis]|uniref:F-box domain-containing protein n=1 Tax=Coemansia javaensis TaxID=2761396 RepID=A0A9W8HBK9_9FUNG|nr:hypothetical protein H4R18_004458 [Coemansia javaensis]